MKINIRICSIVLYFFIWSWETDGFNFSKHIQRNSEVSSRSYSNFNDGNGMTRNFDSSISRVGWSRSNKLHMANELPEIIPSLTNIGPILGSAVIATAGAQTLLRNRETKIEEELKLKKVELNRAEKEAKKASQKASNSVGQTVIGTVIAGALAAFVEVNVANVNVGQDNVSIERSDEQLVAKKVEAPKKVLVGSKTSKAPPGYDLDLSDVSTEAIPTTSEIEKDDASSSKDVVQTTQQDNVSNNDELIATVSEKISSSDTTEVDIPVENKEQESTQNLLSEVTENDAESGGKDSAETIQQSVVSTNEKQSLTTVVESEKLDVAAVSKVEDSMPNLSSEVKEKLPLKERMSTVKVPQTIYQGYTPSNRASKSTLETDENGQVLEKMGFEGRMKPFYTLSTVSDNEED